MTTPDFSTGFSVNQSPETVFNAINNVRGWWSENIKGSTNQLNEEFTYQYEDMHKCTMKIIELVPGRKVVWKVLDNYFNFTKDKNEWKGDNIEFEISEKDNRTQVHFTHRGLVPAYECYDKCYAGWSKYISGSLQSLITTGKGQPNPKEDVAV
jgi:hypothetical protein